MRERFFVKFDAVFITGNYKVINSWGLISYKSFASKN